ncbi:MAG: putative Ig domain-containing protein [Planctomycetota bacterium]|jgi:hypothetical protein
MNRFLKALTVIAAVALMAGAASAATYYVATDGNDETGDGSSGSPWATLQHAVETISAGDTILVKPGTYAGCRIELSGTAANPKTLAAETAGTVLLNSLSSEARHSGVLEVENYSASVSYWVIEGFECDGVSGSYRPIDVRNSETQMNSHITIRNCVAHDGVSTGIFNAFTNYALIEDCTSYDNGEHGFYVNNSADNGVLRGNTSYTNTSNGIHMNGESMGGDGIMSYWLLEDNVCYNNPNTGINCDGVTDSTYRNNLIYEYKGKGFSFYGIDGAVTSKNDRVLNNTVLSESTGTLGYYDVFIHQNRKNKGAPTGMRLYNNILYNYRTATNRGSICMHTSGMGDFESDYNVVMEYFGIDDNKSVDTFAEWQARGFDLNSIQASDTALFEDPANYDYHLKTGSPAIDGGTTLSDVTDDIEGTSRPQGSAYDIGCYEAAGGPPPDLQITTTSLPNGQVNVAYSETLQATGGVTPYTWSIISGALPAGLSLTASTGEISGTPTTEETANFTVQVTDSQEPADTDTQALSITIDPEPSGPTITTTSLPDGTRKVDYSAFVEATGGTPPYTWSIVSGSLPLGLSLNSSTGEISGNPKKAETKNFTVRCTDDASQWDEQALSITINN